MDEEQLRRLLPFSRWVIERWCAEEPWQAAGPLPTDFEDRDIDGLFVTLKRDGQLRGCIGKIGPQPSLAEALRELSVEAAAHDPRFSPVQAFELPAIEIGISVLTPAEPLQDPDNLEIGRDGLIIERGSRKGLLLPEVAVEMKWDRRQFLAGVCEKAFLPADAWQDPSCKLYRFRTLQISETSR